MVDQQKLSLSTRLLPIVGLAPVLITAAFVAASPSFESNATVHWMGQFFTGIFIVFCGILVVRSKTLPTGNPRYILALGLFGAAFLDMFHGSMVMPDTDPATLDILVPWGWLPSRVLLPTMLCLGIWVEIYETRVRRPTGKIVLAAIGIPALMFVAFCAWVMATRSNNLPQIYFPQLPVHRPTEIVPAALFFIALLSQLYKGSWRNDIFEYNLLLVLTVGVITHSLFMPFASGNFTSFFAAATISKIVGYVFLLAGLLLHTREGMRDETEAERIRHRSIVDTASDGILTFDAQGFIDTFNPAAQRLFGYTAAEAVGQNITMLTTQKLQQEHDTILHKVRSGELPPLRSDSYEALGRRKDGSVFPVESAINQVNYGDELLFTAIVRDITERKNEQARLQELSDRLALALESAGLGSWEQNLLTGELTWDKHMYALYGLDPDQGAPSTEQLVEMSFPADTEAYNLAFAKTLDTGAPLDLAFRIRLPNESIRWIKCDGKLVKDSEGSPIHLVGVNRDISASIQYLEELEGARSIADEANRAKSSFLATMSHEIRTPLNGVIGLTEVLQKTELEPYQRDISNLIDQSAHSLLEIIDDILDLSKIEAGKLEIDPNPVSVAKLVEDSCAMLTNQADNASVELRIHVDPALPETVLGDATRLRQILTNLVNNAIKFSSKEDRPGKISVQAMLVSANDTRSEIAFQVKDNGIGMDAMTSARLFSPFTQADASTNRKFGGTGLGLTISQKLAGLMGGKIEVASEPNKGSTFSVNLTFTHCEQGETSSNEYESLAHRRYLNKAHCLVVGPATSQAAGLSSYLLHAGARVSRTDDLSAALQINSASEKNILWIVDVSDEKNVQSELLQTAQTMPNAIIVCSNKALQRQLNAARIEFVDGNVLLRSHFLSIVAERAGGMSDSETHADTNSAAQTQPDVPSRSDAISRNELILIAEDNPTNQEVILLQLAALGYQADVVEDGVQALEQWRSGVYALVLTDLQMPQMDGYELARALRKEEKSGHIPIVALTANTLMDEADKCKAAGMDDYLTKPASLEELRTTIDRWLSAAA